MNIWKKMEEKHIPVLLNELVNAFKINKGKKNIIVDCTLWMWWHASKIIEKMNSWDIFIWFDADIRNLEQAKVRLNELNKDEKIKIILINSNFVNLKEELKKQNIEKITWIYYDLWLSSLHIDEPERWFSIKHDWPLDMRFDNTKWITAEKIINWYKEEELIKLFFEYWEEPSSRKIAKKIVERRKIKKITTTKELSLLIWEVINNPKSKNRIFQALRIEINSELENLEKSLNDAISLLEKDWIIFVISFHSLEDRITKQIFKKETKNCICNDLICSCWHKQSLEIKNKKPILPTSEEIKNNIRSRSAKARYAKKII